MIMLRTSKELYGNCNNCNYDELEASLAQEDLTEAQILERLSACLEILRGSCGISKKSCLAHYALNQRMYKLLPTHENQNNGHRQTGPRAFSS